MIARLARPLEIALGALFVLSAALKALNVYAFAVQVAAYGIVRDPSIVQAIAFFMIALETILGVALLAGLRLGGLTAAVTAALLVGFSGLIAYAWAFKGLADCGCFGEYVKMGPGASIAKNLVLLAMAFVVWRGTRMVVLPARAADDGAVPAQTPQTTSTTARLALGGFGILVVLAAFVFGESAPSGTEIKSTANAASGKFAEFVPDLGGAPVPLAQGEFFVAMLSASCDHCRDVTVILNDLNQTPGVPQIAALMLGTEDEMKEFRAATDPQFPIQTIEPLKFMNLLGDASAPPCFYLIRDGAEVRTLIAEEPTYEELREFATKGQAPPADGQQ